MLTLYVLRHGEAENGIGAADRDRALTAAGAAAMQELSTPFSALPQQPSMALCSPALRTRQTQRAAAPALPVQIIEDIYDADAARLLQIVQGVDDTHRAVLLVGHNPAVHQLVAMLAGDGDEALVQVVTAGYKPGTLAVIESRMMRWETFDVGVTTLVNLLVPPFAGKAAG